MSRRGRSEEEEKNEEKMMLRDAGTTSNRRSKNRPGAAGLWGGGHGWRRWPIRTGYMRWWNHRPTNDSLPSGEGIGMVRYRTVIYITGLPQTPIIVIVYTKDIIL